MDKVRDIGVTQLVRRYLKIQAVSHFPVMRRFLSKFWSDRMFYTHSVLISVIHPFLGCPGDNILPKSLKLRVGQGNAIPVCNHTYSEVDFAFASRRHSARQSGRGTFLSAAFVFSSVRMTGLLCSVCHALRTVR